MIENGIRLNKNNKKKESVARKKMKSLLIILFKIYTNKLK